MKKDTQAKKLNDNKKLIPNRMDFTETLQFASI